VKPINFALLGCGRIARKHVDALRAIPGARLAAVCDIRREAAERIAGRDSGIRIFDDLDAMLADREGIDVVSILTPSGLHAEHAVRVARAGRHVVVEKPMALRVTDADVMIEACDQAGVKLFVVKQNRYNVAVQHVRRALEAGRFGRLVLGTVRVRWCRRQDYYDLDPWRGTWALDGGVFANQASHHVDLLQWMLGPVASVFAQTQRYLVNIEAEDTGVAVLTFRSGALGVIEATTATRPADLEGSLTIMGESGVAEVGGFAVNEMRVWQFAERRPEDAAILAQAKEMPENVYGFGHAAFLTNVVKALSESGRALVDGLEGRKSVELICAIYESAAARRSVDVPCPTVHSLLGQPRPVAGSKP